MMKQSRSISVCITTLGCSKNLIDAECMTSVLQKDGFNLVTSMDKADIIVINTCGFIESAKREAIAAILDAAEHKIPNGRASHLLITGCLAQRYPDEILTELPEVDAVLGTAHYHDVARVIHQLLSDSSKPQITRVSKPGGMDHLTHSRIVSTFPYAWLKIAEGCSKSCAYCAIPGIRGPYQSRPMDEIIAEAKFLSEQGFYEIILAAQDTTFYGKDLCGKLMLTDLIKEISKIEKIHSIRIMYAYLDGITQELIAEIRDNPKVAHYLDIPVQHGDDRVLQRMRRIDRVKDISFKISSLREQVPDIVLRTTVIVGFPGETEEEFSNLCEMIRYWKFDRLGCFMYSLEEETAAASMESQIAPDVALDRYNQVMTIQNEISLNANCSRIGSIVPVTIDSIAEDGIFYIGRSYGEAPEVDPVIWVLASASPLQLGSMYDVRILDCSPYDMTGVTTDEPSK